MTKNSSGEPGRSCAWRAGGTVERIREIWHCAVADETLPTYAYVNCERVAMKSDLVQDGPPRIGANYLLAAVVARSEGRLKLEGELSPLAWEICDYLYVLAYRDRHSARASSVSYHELMSLLPHGEGEEAVAKAMYSLQTTLIQCEQGMDFFYSAQVVMTDELSPHLFHFRVPDAIRWVWARLDAEL